MTTFIIGALVVGAIIGGGIGFKVGRGYERLRPRKKKKKSEKNER